MGAKTQSKTTTIQKIIEELKKYAAIFLYLYVCFGAVIFYKHAVLRGVGIDYAPYGFAVIKALILSKFMIFGHALHVGERYGNKPLIYAVLYESALFLAMLVVLTVLEEAIVGVIHGRTVRESVSDIASGGWLQVVAACILLWLVLVPYCMVRQIDKVQEEDKLHRMFFVTR